MDKENIIPVVYCFSDNYTIAAAPAFYSMLENADKNYFYKIFVLHSNITEENQAKLRQTISPFKNADLTFMDMNNRFDELFQKTKEKKFYTKEMYYKYLAPELFKEFDKIIITDADVVFEGDISKEFNAFNTDDDYYIAGCSLMYRDGFFSFVIYPKNEFTEEEIHMYSFSGGYYIYNLKKMRADNMLEKFIKCTEENKDRLRQPEMDVINMCCYPRIKPLPVNTIVCNYHYDMFYDAAQYDKDIKYKPEEVKYALENPLQLHFAGYKKPWLAPEGTKTARWYYYLSKTPLMQEQLNRMALKKPADTVRLFKLSSKKLKKNFVFNMQIIPRESL